MYAYCGNDPVNRLDPQGTFWACFFGDDTDTHFNGDRGSLGGGVNVAGTIIVGLLSAGLLIYANSHAKSESIEKPKSIPIITATDKVSTLNNSPVYFPEDPFSFNPKGLIRVERPGTKNGRLISWMDPATNIEVFRWDENTSKPNGPHYHIYSTGHYYPGMMVPEPYASIYFPTR